MDEVRRPLLLAAAVLALAGCRADDSPQRRGEAGRLSADEPRLGGDASPAPERETPGGTLVAALGDSITAGSPLWDPEPATRDQIGSSADPRSQYEHWATRRLRNVRFRNCGVFGERTDQIAARLPDCAREAQVLIVQGGINDIAQRRSARSAARNLHAMVRRGKTLGLRVALVEVLPWNNGYPLAAPRVGRLNRLINGIGRDERVPVFPWYRALEDRRARGRMRSDLTIDGDHPSIAGYRRLAEEVRLP